MSYKPSFRQFIEEQTLQATINNVAMQMVGGPIQKIDSIKERDIETARELLHRFVKAADGSWIINVFKATWGKFIRIDPPKGSPAPQEFYVPVNKEEEYAT
jgi:hypothetical protein